MNQSEPKQKTNYDYLAITFLLFHLVFWLFPPLRNLVPGYLFSFNFFAQFLDIWLVVNLG